MAESRSLGKYLEDYSNEILSKCGKEFSYSAFIDKTKTKGLKPSGLTSNFIEEKIDFPWLDELELVTEKIMSIASKPRTHIKFEKDVKKAEQAVKIDNYDIIETLKVPPYWRRKGGRFVPEKVFTDIYEIENAIYENRFIINLVDKMMLFLAQIVAQLYQQIKKVNHNFIDSHISLADVEVIQDIAGFGSYKYLSKSSNRSKKVKEEDATLLTTKDSHYVDALRRILIARGNVGHIRSTPFYKEVKKAKPLSDSDVHITNMLAGDPSYAPCYNFYRKLLPLLSKNIGNDDVVNPKDYHNFVVSNILAAFDDLGFKEEKNKSKIAHKNNLVVLDNYRLIKDSLVASLMTKDEDHIDIHFEVIGDDFKGTENLSLKKQSTVSLDLVPSTTAEYPNEDELAEYFAKKIQKRLRSGYTNAFIITPVDNTQKDDVMICSPLTYKIDANVKSMIDSCIIFAEGDNYIYSHVCPVCGFYVDGEQEDGNCYCANCDSAYSLMVSGKGKEAKENVWIKRLKNPDN